MIEEYIDNVNDFYYNYCDSVSDFCSSLPTTSKILTRMCIYINDLMLVSGESIEESFQNLKKFKTTFKHNSEVIEETILDIMERHNLDDLQLKVNDVADKKQAVLDSITDAWNFCYAKTAKLLNRDF